jgi:hypothetical protein
MSTLESLEKSVTELTIAVTSSSATFTEQIKEIQKDVNTSFDKHRKQADEIQENREDIAEIKTTVKTWVKILCTIAGIIIVLFQTASPVIEAYIAR